MKITAGAVVLAGADTFNGHRGLRVDGREVVEETAVIGADGPARYARGNRTVGITFEARKQYNDADAADAAVVALATGWDGLVSVVCKTNDDATTLLTLTDASVDVTAASAGTVVAYSVTIRGIKA